MDCGYRIDVLVEDALILELKSVEEIKGIHEAQLLTYMKLADVKTGLLINFNVTKLKDGIERGNIVYEDEDREDFLARMGDHAQRQPVIAFLNNSKVS